MLSDVRPGGKLVLCALALLLTTTVPRPASAQVDAFSQTVAAAASDDESIAQFYAGRHYRTVWTGPGDEARRAVLLDALSRASDHGLPVQRYDVQALVSALRTAATEGDRGRLEVQLTQAYLDYAHDLYSGVLEPKKVDSTIVREVPHRTDAEILAQLDGADLAGFLADLPPTAPAYKQLMKAKLDLEREIAAGGWGTPAGNAGLKPGAEGDAVVALRDRLVRMGYMPRSASRSYDSDMQRAVQRFQLAHGLEPDGIADEGTMTEVNISPAQRLQSVVVAMERERWINIDRGNRYIWVNLADFQTKIIENGQETFVTRSVIGKPSPDLRTPEFSDEMEYMVVNPSWSVPRSITTKEYLPLLKKNPNAVSYMQILDSRGRVVSRSAVNFNKYSASNFPYAMRQPPSDGNALGLVKFMFPNQWNIYLHDTPTKSLFQREVRAFSHGCIRLGRPFDFANALLARQTDDPEGEFQRTLKTKQEQAIQLKQHVPVHLVYFTAFPDTRGDMNYRRDIYGRDTAIFNALTDAGVVLGGQQG